MLRLITSLAFVFTMATSAAAFDLTDMSDTEREVFRAEVRAYLLDNPEIIIEVIGVLEQRSAEASREADRQMIRDFELEIFDDGYSYVGGNPEGELRIVEFVDYRCGYCRRAHPEMEAILSKNDDIRFVLKELPVLGEDSATSARFAIATRMLFGSDAYKQVHDALMNLQPVPSEAVLRRLADGLDLDADAILQEMDSEDVTIEIFRNQALANALEITGTPAFVVETELMRGYTPQSNFEVIINAVREEIKSQ